MSPVFIAENILHRNIHLEDTIFFTLSPKSVIISTNKYRGVVSIVSFRTKLYLYIQPTVSLQVLSAYYFPVLDLDRLLYRKVNLQK